MARHKKIPKKKKKKDRDLSDVYRAEKYRQLKLCNNPIKETKLDDQEIPNSIRSIMHFKTSKKGNSALQSNEANALIKKNATRKHSEAMDGASKPIKPLRILPRDSGETDEHFNWRMKEMTQEYLEEAEMENKFGVNVIKDHAGNINVEKRVRDKFDEEVERALNPKKFKKFEEARARKLQKKRERNQKRKAKKKKSTDTDFELKKEFIPFGEIVYQPPKITFKPRGSR